jgi:hypothetical protein
LHEGLIIALGVPDEIRRSHHPIIRQLLEADFKREKPNL